MQSPTNAANNPFLSSAPTNNQPSIVDLFGPTPTDNGTNATKASDDLLSLGNPFADMFGGKWWEFLSGICDCCCDDDVDIILQKHGDYTEKYGGLIAETDFYQATFVWTEIIGFFWQYGTGMLSY